MSKHSFEAEYFEETETAKGYKYGRPFNHLLLYILLKLNHKRNLRYLDIGCAYGHSVEEARKLGMEAFGVEISRYALERAENKSFIVQGDACDLPFKDENFDIVSILEVVEHLPEPTKSLQECYRILKDDGMLILSTPSKIGQPYLKSKGIRLFAVLYG